MGNAAQRMVRVFLDGPARLASTIALARGKVEVWAMIGRRPPTTCAYFVSDSRCFRLGSSWGAVTQGRRFGHVDLADEQTVLRLIALGPVRHVVAVHESQVPADPAAS
jgi:hypothetical protein